MTVVVYLLLFICFFYCNTRRFNHWYNIINIFNIIWCTFGIISLMGLFDLRIPKTRTHIYVWIFVFTVNLVVLLSRKTVINYYDLSVDTRYSFLLQLLAIILSIPMYVQIISVILNRGLLAGRDIFYDGLFESVYSNFFFRTIPMSIFNGLIIFWVYTCYENSDFKYMKYAIFNTLLLTLTNGGRYALFLFGCANLMCLSIKSGSQKVLKSKIKNNKNINRRFILSALIVSIITIFVTRLRGMKILEGSVLYFSGSLSFLDYIIDNPNVFALNQNLFGYLTFSFIIEPIVLLLKVFGLTTAKVPSYYFNIVCQPFYNIGEGKTVTFNANTTILYYFLRDFGIAGIIIGGVLLSVLIMYYYRRYTLLGTPFSGCMLIYMANVLLTSIMTYKMFGQMPLFIFITLFICTRKYRKAKV